jgi:hypothetical protein
MATAAFTTVEDRGVGDPLTEPIWDDELRDNINQLAGAHRNLLTNGGFEVWQRGAGGFTTTLAYTADRWQMSLGAGSTLTVTQETSTIDSYSTSALKGVFTLSAGTTSLSQKVEDYKALVGRTVSVSLRVRQGAASAIQIQLNDGVGVTTSTLSATTGSYITITATRTLSASATQFLVNVLFLVSGTHYLDNAMLVIGPAPAPYQPFHPQEDLARCQRYYEVVGDAGGGTVRIASVATAGAQGALAMVPWKATKAVAPTVTKVGTWTVTNCGQPTINLSDKYGTVLLITSSAAGEFSSVNNVAGNSITAEANP